jgi:hypothetical protein
MEEAGATISAKTNATRSIGIKMMDQVFTMMLDWQTLPGITIDQNQKNHLWGLLMDIAGETDPQLAAKGAELVKQAMKLMDSVIRSSIKNVSPQQGPAQATVTPKIPKSTIAHTPAPPTAQPSQAKDQERPISYAKVVSPQPQEYEEWTIVGKDGKLHHVSAPKNPAGHSAPPLKPKIEPRWKLFHDQLNDSMLERWLSGKRCRPNELSFVYVKGVPRSPFWETRACFEKYGINQQWITEMSFIHGNTLEMLVHEERVADIFEKLHKIGMRASCNMADILGTEIASSTEFLTGMRTRMKKRLETLNPRARGVRHHIRVKVEELEEILMERMPKPTTSCQ